MSQHDATPPEGGVILGMGGTFRVPGNGFQGWTMIPERSGLWISGYKLGKNRICLYAAPEGSEVVRMNRKPCADPNCDDGRTWVTDLEGQPKRIDCGCENTPESETPRRNPVRAFLGSETLPEKKYVLESDYDSRLRQLERENRRLRGILKEAHSFTRGFSGRKVDKINKRLEEALAGRGE